MASEPSNSGLRSPGGMQDGRIKGIFLALIGIIAAIFIGSWLPGAGPRELLYTSIVAIGLIYTLFLSPYALYFALLTVVLDIQMRPTSFQMSSVVLVGALLGPVFLLNIWRKDLSPSREVLKWSREYRFFTIVAITYSVVHCWYTWKNPIYTFAISNIAKSYYALIFSFFLIFWFSVKPPAIRFPKNPIFCVSLICFFGLLFNIIVRIYGTYFLGLGTSDFLAASEIQMSAIFIPIINLNENIFALRTLSPFTALVATVFLTSKNPATKKQGMRFFLILLLCLSVFGALISMGRATVIFTFALSVFIMVWRGKTAPVVFLALFGVLCLTFVRIGFEASPDLVPKPIQRAVALIPGMHMESVEGSIRGSSDWRLMIFEMALEEWQSSSRVFWFGRSTAGVTGSDVAQFATPEFKDSIKLDMALKRGATHSLLTDYLVVVGLVGAILFFVLWTCAILFMFRMARACHPESSERQLFIIAGLFTLFQLVYGIIGGAHFPVQSAVIVCLGILVIRDREKTEQRTEGFSPDKSE